MLTRNFIVKINLSKYHSLKRFKHKATHWVGKFHSVLVKH